MAEDDSEWIVESIVGYLGSPEWVIPVTDFMENKCTGEREYLISLLYIRALEPFNWLCAVGEAAKLRLTCD